LLVLNLIHTFDGYIRQKVKQKHFPARIGLSYQSSYLFSLNSLRSPTSRRRVRSPSIYQFRILYKTLDY